MRQPVRLVVFFAVLAAAIPLVLARPAPLTDWANHLARVDILCALIRGDAMWRRFYALNPLPVPNAALDLGIGALHLAGMNLDWAASVFLLLAYAVFVGGFCRLARAFGAFDATKPLLGSLLFFTGPLMYGLVNYMLGLGVACWILAEWRSASARRRLWVAALGTLVLFYVHLLAAAVWVLAAGCLEAPAIIAALRRRALPRHSLSTACAGVVFLALLMASDAGADSLPQSDGSNLWYPGHGAPGPTAAWKASIVLRMVADHATEWMTVLTVIGLAAFVLLAVARGHARMSRGAMLAVAALAATVLVLPESAGTGSLLDYRLALTPFLIGAAALRVRWPSRRARLAAVAILLVVSLGRGTGFAMAFSAQAGTIHTIEAALARLAPGTTLLSGFGHGRDDIPDQLWWSPPTEHLAARAVMNAVFVPTVFAYASQQPVVLKPEYDAWRRTWQLRDAGELATMIADIRPLCATSDAEGRHVAMFVAYPGAYLDAVVAPAHLLASGAAFRLLDVCAIPSPAS